MKRIYYRGIQIVAAVLLLLAVACEKEIDPWGGDDSIYFGVRMKTTATTWSKELYDTTAYSFVYAPTKQEDTLIRIRVNVLGKSSSTERPVAWEVADSSTAVAGENYVIENERVVVPADSTHTFIGLRLKRSELLRSEKRMIVLQLLPNEYFGLNQLYYQYPNRNRQTSIVTHCVVFDDMMTDWPEWGRKMMQPWWGTFSRDKMDFICEVIKIETLDFMDKDYMSIGRIMYIAKRVQKELDKRKADGDPVMDGDREMTLKN